MRVDKGAKTGIETVKKILNAKKEIYIAILKLRSLYFDGIA